MDILRRCIPLIEAGSDARMANVMRLAQAKQRDYENGLRELRKMAEPKWEADPVAKVAPEAAEWFRRNGIPFEVADD